MNKRGISAVVATVLIILITIAATVILWAALIPMVTDQLTRDKACLDATSKFLVTTACVNGSEYLSFQIVRRAGVFDLSDLQITVGVSNGDILAVSFLRLDNTSTVDDLPGENEFISVTRNFQGANKNATDRFTQFSVAPVIRIGDEDVICSPAHPIALQEC